MKNISRKLGAMAVLIVLSTLAVEPAMAEHRRDYKQNRHHNKHQPFSHSNYKHKYDKHRYGRSGSYRIQARRHQQRHHDRYGHHDSGYNSSRYAHHYAGHNNNYSGYDNHYRGYQSDHHRHRHGIVVLSGAAYGYSYCDLHHGYYRSGDIYY